MKKRKQLLSLGMVLLAGLIFSGCGKSEMTQTSENEESGESASGELNLYTWAGMFPQEVLTGFEEETGVKINYSNFDYDEDMLAKLEETKGGDYDYVIADDYILELIKKEGLCQNLEKSKLSNLSNVNEAFTGQFYDPEDEFAIPYGAGIPLIVYDPALVDFEITGYEDLWNEALKDNVAIIGNYRVIDGITLKTMGESFNTEEIDKITEAGEKLKQLAPNIRIISDSNTQDYLVSGEVAAAFLYSSQVIAATTAREDLKVVYPKEGLGFGIMAGFIPSNAPNKEAAYAFADYLLRPEIAAQCTEFIGYYSTNKAAEEYISEELKEKLILPEDAAKGEIIQNISVEAEDTHSKIWNEFKSQCE